MDYSDNKITLTYKYNDANVSMSFGVDNAMSEYVDYYKRFLLACSFNPDTVKDLRYGDEDMCIVKDRIKSALEILESIDNKDDKVSKALDYLNEAYDC